MIGCARLLQPFGLLLALVLTQLVSTLRLADQQASAVQGPPRLHPVQLLRKGSKVGKTGQVEADVEEAVSEAEDDEADEDGDATSVAEEQGGEDANDEQEDILTLTVGNAVPALGMKMFNLPPVDCANVKSGPCLVKVDHVTKGGWADENGIEDGAFILTVNGKVAKDMLLTDFLTELKKRPTEITVKPPEDPAAPAAAAVATPQGAVKPFGGAAPAANGLPPAVVPAAPAPAPMTQKQVKAEKKAVVKKLRKLKKKAVKKALKKAKKKLKKKIERIIAKAAVPGASVEERLKAGIAAATAAGKAAGFGAAKKMMDDFKDSLKSKARKKKKKKTTTTTLAPTTTPLTPPGGAPGPAPGPALWGLIKPEGMLPKPCADGAGEPAPPSPLDALKAAMAIRANLTDGHGPLLPDDVLDKVADMAHSRLGGFVPHTPGQPCFQPAPAPAPVALTGPVIDKVEVIMTVKNMSFTALQASPGMMAEFEQSVKQSMAEAAGPGVKPSEIQVTLSPGSVIVDSKITPPVGLKADDMNKNIANGANNVGARLIARVAALPGIDTVALGVISAGAIVVKVVHEVAPTTMTTTTTPPSRHLPKPPKCAAPPPKMTKGEVAMAMAPFKPPGARGKGVKTQDGGKAWPLTDGGWAFQYPDMALRMAEDGSTRIVWSKPAYSVEYDESGISYHVGQNVVHRDTNGDLTYQQPTGTMHQEGDTLVYHWCNPNVIVYQTPDGFVYYDDMGMTYRSFGKDVTHYTWSGEVLYQGAGGVTRQGSDGTVTHWTDAGAVYRHADGSVFYTPVGESTSQALSVSDLGPDPFPGAALTTEDVMRLSIPAAAVGAPVPAVPAR